jgi:CDP-paratose 2-epimerase
MAAKTIVITGGAGFIGVNAAEAFIEDGWRTVIFDNLSRKGSDLNLNYLEQKYPGDCEFILGDVRYDYFSLLRAVGQADLVLHLAAQVAVTTSILRPLEDFDINARGTFNVLEAVRESGNQPLVVYSSTNKVYGSLPDVVCIPGKSRYTFRDFPSGIAEDRPLDFHSPYGCSKGAADQYVHDYGRIYDIPTVVFRQSCVYGQRQFGVEDQGWVAWFAIAAVLDRPIQIYGDGSQLRDLLHIDDLIRLYKCAAADPARSAGQIFNVGGGPTRTLSLIELLVLLEQQLATKIRVSYAAPRAGDQPVFVADIRKAEREFGWHPVIDPLPGIEMLLDWICENRVEVERVVNSLNPTALSAPRLVETEWRGARARG